MTDIELKKCPFCGETAKLIEHPFHNLPSSFGVICQKCRSQSSQFFDTAEDAASAWNIRNEQH